MSSSFNLGGSQETEKQPALKKKGVGIAAAALVLIGATACSVDSEQQASSTSADASVASSEVVAGENVAEQPAHEGQAGGAEAEVPAEADVPMEYRQALRSAESYLSFSGFSYDGLYDQLTSEYADNFSPEAARYAVDNVNADWNAEAVESAESYLEFSGMSPDGLYDQLTSEYADKYTPEQAQYAVDTVFAQ